MVSGRNLPISYKDFLQHLRNLQSGGLISDTGERLLDASEGWHNLQGHVKQSFYGVQLFLLKNKKLIPTIAAYDVRKPMPLRGKILKKWVKFIDKNKKKRTSEYDIGILRRILPSNYGGLQTSGGGAMAFVGRSIVLTAQLLFRKGYSGPSGRDNPEPSDQVSPGRRKQSILRIIRDTEMIRSLKRKYGYVCQVCRYASVRVGPGEYYVEGNHLRPLGNPHNGTDTSDNIILLCPNHHVLFDKFAISIDPHDCRTIVSHDVRYSGKKILTKHKLRVENVRYHYLAFKSLWTK